MVFDEFVLVGRYEAHPCVVVDGACHHHVGAGGGCRVHLLDGGVVECAVGAAPCVGQNAVVGSIPLAAVVGSATLAAVAVSVGDGEVDGCRKARLIVDLPDVVERDLGLVEMVLVGDVSLTVEAVTESGVVAVHAFAVHIVLHVLPSFYGKAVGRLALPVVLGRTEGCKAQLMVVVDLFRYVDKPCESVKLSALDISVAPFAATHDCNGPAILHKSGGSGESDVVHIVVAHSVEECAALFRIKALRGDVESAAD